MTTWYRMVAWYFILCNLIFLLVEIENKYLCIIQDTFYFDYIFVSVEMNEMKSSIFLDFSFCWFVDLAWLVWSILYKTFLGI